MRETGNLVAYLIIFIYSKVNLTETTACGVKNNYVEMHLGLWGRFLVLVAGTSVVIMTVFIVACFVGPGCWGFEYLRREENKKKRQIIENLESKCTNESKPKPDYYWLGNENYTTFETSPGDFETVNPNLKDVSIYHQKERVFNVKCAPLLVAPNFYPVPKNSIPKLDIKLFYSALDDGEIEGRLTVQIISASFLPHREYITTLDPFVTLEIINNKWSLQKHERIVHTMNTPVVKNSLNPYFNHTFVVNVKKMELKNWCLKFTISDDDPMIRVTPLHERRIYLKDVKNLMTPEHIPLNLEMQEVMDKMGELLLGISYLPTAQRLNINVIKAAKLKYQSNVLSLNEFYPYVRVVMVNNHGKFIKKKKTCWKHKDENPIFNHSLVFDLSISNLEQTTFLLMLCTKTLSQPNSDDSSVDGEIESSLKENKDKVLGAIVLGRNVRCTRGRDHWVTVMQNPRKMISLWHDLR